MTSYKGRISGVFDNKDKGQKVMSLFLTAGYPEPGATVELAQELEASGADILELGMPFSDPLADGPTIQYASKVALDQGVNLDTIFEMVREIRRRSNIPIVLMGYINPVLKYGLDTFFRNASRSGVDGVIIPDVPPGEMPELDQLCSKYRIDPVYLVAPNTADERMREIDQASRGFVYCVSVAGVTGARSGDEVSRSVKKFINRVRANVTRNPVLVGFGIRTHADAVSVSAQTDGFIVGSALIDYIRGVYPDPDWVRRTGEYVRDLKYGPNGNPTS
jgi:tryptophan synthase alpha chain